MQKCETLNTIHCKAYLYIYRFERTLPVAAIMHCGRCLHTLMHMADYKLLILVTWSEAVKEHKFVLLVEHKTNR
jgi:hypothetical protein